MPIQCEVVTQDKILYEGPADIVVIPGAEGQFGVLPNHSPVLAALDIGILVIRHADGEEVFTVGGGVVEVQPDLVTVLADVGESIEQIDQERAEAARQRAEELLREVPETDTDEYLAVEAALRRSNLRLEAVRRYRKGRSGRLQISDVEGA